MLTDITFSAPIGSEHYGLGYLHGYLRVAGVATSRLIYVTERATYKLVAAGYSAADGYYRFDYLNPEMEFDFRAQDHERVKADAILSARKPIPYG